MAGCFVQEPGSSPACACPLVRKAWKPDVAQLLEGQGGFIWGGWELSFLVEMGFRHSKPEGKTLCGYGT